MSSSLAAPPAPPAAPSPSFLAPARPPPPPPLPPLSMMTSQQQPTDASSALAAAQAPIAAAAQPMGGVDLLAPFISPALLEAADAAEIQRVRCYIGVYVSVSCVSILSCIISCCVIMSCCLSCIMSWYHVCLIMCDSVHVPMFSIHLVHPLTR